MKETLLSICIPTYNRADLLEQVLQHLRFVNDFNFAVEIIISDNDSSDKTADVVKSAMSHLPMIRYFRQEKNVGGMENFVSVFRNSRTKYSVYLADDDRLIPENLEKIVAYLEENKNIAAVQTPWEIWDDVSKKTISRFYHIEKPLVFSKQNALDCFNFLINKHVMPEIAVYRTEIFHKVLYLPHRINISHITLVKMLQFGDVCFHPLSFYRSISRSDWAASGSRGQMGHDQAIKHIDQYRGGLEAALFKLFEYNGTLPFPMQTKNAALESINSFVCGRMGAASRLSKGKKDFIAAHEFYVRNLLWQRQINQNALVEWERNIVPLAAIQNVIELFEQNTFLKKIVLYGFENPESIVSSFRFIRENVPVEVRTKEDIFTTDVPDKTLVLTNLDGIRDEMTENGFLPGFIILYEELLSNFRILPRSFDRSCLA